MKKLFCVLISVAIILSSFCVVGVQAANGSFALGSASCTYGKTATLQLSVNGGINFAAAVIDLSYDTSAIRLASVSSSSFEADFSTDSNGATITLFDLDNTTTIQGVVASLEFLSVNGAGEFEITMSAEDGNVCDADGNALSVGFSNGKISVSCDHYYVYDRTIDPTCYSKGQIIYICRRCNGEDITYIDKTAHVPGAWVTTKEPDCDDNGLKEHLCSVCSEALETQDIPALGHIFGETLVDVEPTCNSNGVSYKLCKICNHEEYGVISASNHGNASWKTTSPAGCEVGGIASLVCNDCGDVLETKTIDAAGHLYAWAVISEPTCNAEGTEAYVCLVCGEIQQTRSLAKLEHKPGKEFIAVKPTCDKAGEKHVCCEVCGEVVSNTEVNKLEHTYGKMTVVTAPNQTTNGVGKYFCKTCGEEIETVTLPATNAAISLEGTKCFVSDLIKIPVNVSNNPGFSAGVITVNYSAADLIYQGVETAAVTDITVGVSDVGELTILMCPDSGDVTVNGIFFYLLFEVVDGAADNEVTVNYNAETDFADEDGKPVFFNLSNAKVDVYQYLLGDLDYDLEINAADLALMKKMVAGLIDVEYDPAADVVIDGIVNAADLAQLKKYIAGFVTSFN